MLPLPNISMPIESLSFGEEQRITVHMKREDLIDTHISGNKYWKLYHNINEYLKSDPKSPLIITFGGAYSNHIAAVAALGKLLSLPTLGIIRGEELSDARITSPTLLRAASQGMDLVFTSRDRYRFKEELEAYYSSEFPHALVVPEGGTNSSAVKGIANMLDVRTTQYDVLCVPVGTGGTLAGITRYKQSYQKAIGMSVVKDLTLKQRIYTLANSSDFNLVDASQGRYGKVSDALIAYCNSFYDAFKIPLDPVYTGKMMFHLQEMIGAGYFAPGTKVLVFHTGGLQGISGINQTLRIKKKNLLNFEDKIEGFGL